MIQKENTEPLTTLLGTTLPLPIGNTRVGLLKKEILEGALLVRDLGVLEV